MNVRYRWIMGCLIAATTVMAGCGRHGMGPRVVDPSRAGMASAARADDRAAAAGERDEDENERESEETAQDDYFYMQRRLPDGRINLEARSRAVTHARFLRARGIAFT